MMKKVPVVFLSADPKRDLSLDEDLRRIKEKVRAARYRDALDFEVCPAARFDDLMQALHEKKPQIVHFSGHARVDGLMMIHPDGSRADWVSAEDFTELLTAFRDSIRVVVLSACSTRTQAKAIADIVGCAIGTPEKIKDEAAIVFNAEFYRAIAFGESVRGAYDKACASLRGEFDHVRPDLEVGDGVDASQLIPVPKPLPLLRTLTAVGAILIGVALAARVLGGPDGGAQPVGQPAATVATAALSMGASGPGTAGDLAAARELHRVGNHAASFPLFMRAAEAGIPEAMGFLGMAYLRGEGTDRSPDSAAHWLALAAHAGDARGMNAYGLAHEDGFGVGQSYRWAMRWYETAATEKHDAEAMRNLARLHRQGLGTVRRDSLALDWYLKAVDAGSVEAIVDVGLMYAEGVNGRRDVEQALRWWQRAADAGSHRAMHAIGRLHEDAKRHAQALDWYRRAADAGSAEAMNNLGVLYQQGLGVTSDRAEAARWYRRAAEAGSTAAVGNLTALRGS